MIRREISSIDDAYSIRWVSVDTGDGPVRALVFWAGPRGDRLSDNMPLTSVARLLARACGHMGSCAEYLYLTVKHLEEKASVTAICGNCSVWLPKKSSAFIARMKFKVN